LKNSRQIPQK